MPDHIADRYGYGQYSARYDNVYTARQWAELLEEARSDVAMKPIVWEPDDRFFDAKRPSVEPKGLSSRVEVAQARKAHIEAVRSALSEVECTIFTLGLTEAWIDRESGRTLPTAPGTFSGNITNNPTDFINFGYKDVLEDWTRSRELLKIVNPDMRFLLTVSPVPLTATSAHVVQASTASKAILRAASDAIVRRYNDVDYFPSYEIITTSVVGGPFFDQNLRSPNQTKRRSEGNPPP